METYHDRVRETVMARLDPEATRAITIAWRSCWRPRATPIPRSSACISWAPDLPERAAGHYARAAEQAAETLAFERAAALYRLALESCAAAGAGQDWALHARLGDALASAGARCRGGELLPLGRARTPRRRGPRTAATRGHAVPDQRAHRRGAGHAPGGARGRRHAPARHAATGLDVAPLAAGEVRLRGLGFRERDPGAIAPADLNRIDVCWSASVGLSVVDTIRGADFQRGLLLALAAGEPSRIARALAMEAAHAASTGGPNRKTTERLLAIAEDLGRRVEHPYALGMVTLARGVAAYLEGRWTEAQKRCDQAESIFRDRCTGVAWEINTASALLALGAEPPGRGGRALPPLAAAAGPGARAGEPVRGDEPELVPHVDREARRGRPRRGPGGAGRDDGPMVAPGLPRPAQRRPLGGRPDRALPRRGGGGLGAAPRVVAGAAALAPAPGPVHPHVDALPPGPGGPGRGRRQRHSRPAEARSLLAVADRDARKLAREGMPCPEAYARMIRGALAASRGDHARGALTLAEAVRLFDAVDMRLCSAAVRRRLGELMGGDSGQADVAHADHWMTDQKIQNPACMAAMILARLN